MGTYVRGWMALLIWSVSASFMASLLRLPATECLAISWIIAALMAAVRLTYTQRWSLVGRAPWPLLCFAGLCFIANDILYFEAFHFAPAAQVDLISWLWPILALLALQVFEKKLSYRYWLMAGIGLLCVYAISPLSETDGSLWVHHLLGLVLSFLAACTWVLYLMASMRMAKVPVEVVGCYMGIAALILLCMQGIGGWVMPHGHEYFGLFYIGVMGSSLAYWLWEDAVKKGAVSHLSATAYLSPLLSVWWLWVSGYAKMSWLLVFATALMTMMMVWVGRHQWLEKM